VGLKLAEKLPLLCAKTGGMWYNAVTNRTANSKVTFLMDPSLFLVLD
jgi:hypothetical protein